MTKTADAVDRPILETECITAAAGRIHLARGQHFRIPRVQQLLCCQRIRKLHEIFHRGVPAARGRAPVWQRLRVGML